MIRVLRLLERAERAQADAIRSRMAELGRRQAEVLAARDLVQERYAAEVETGLALPGGSYSVAAYAAAMAAGMQADARLLASLAAEEDECSMLLVQHGQRARSLAMVHDRLSDRASAAAIRQAQLEVDERAGLRHVAPHRPGVVTP